MNYSAGDLIDRLNIVKLKCERLGDDGVLYYEERDVLQKEVDLIVVSSENKLILSLAESQNYWANAYIWDLEKDIRTGALDNNKERVGDLAIIIRKFNALRVGSKNIINALTKTGFQERKLDHVSQQ
jgi:hypothetical protein